MIPSSDYIRILPEIILSIFGMLVMVAEPLMGHVVTDAQQRSSDPHILAIGDVAGEPMLAHKASHQGKTAVEALHPGLEWTEAHFLALKSLGGFNNDFRLAAAALALASEV